MPIAVLPDRPINNRPKDTSQYPAATEEKHNEIGRKGRNQVPQINVRPQRYKPQEKK